MEHRLKICFLFNAQRHQLLHGIATAFRMARDPRFEVTVMSPTQEHLDYARGLCRKWGEDRIRYVCPAQPILRAAWRIAGGAIPPKLLSLLLLIPLLRRFDAIAVPERTSILLKWLGMRAASFIHLDHGAGDRAAGFDRRIRRFDFVLMAGQKHRARLWREGLIRAGDYAVVGYPKFEAADAARDPAWTPFPGDDRRIVLYNPHFSSLGSWSRMGEAVLEAFASQDRYNLVLAPHVRMFDSTAARQRWSSLVERYAGNPRIHMDMGSDRSIDMTYTTLADVYLGDVSSQVYEFIRVPRPCLFLDAAGIDWRDDENYAHWHFGKVLSSTDHLLDEVDAARAGQAAFAGRQVEALNLTFSQEERLPSERAAAAIGSHLVQRHRAQAAHGEKRRAITEPVMRVLGDLAVHAAVVAPALMAGWLLHEVVDPAKNVELSDFVDEAVASHQVLLLRYAMHSQPEVRDFQPEEIRAATGIVVPSLPAGWHVQDVQVFPSDTGPSVQLMIEAPGNVKIAMVVMKRTDTPAGRVPLLEKRKSEEIAYWEQDGTAIALVGPSSTDLLRLATSVSSS